MFYDSIPQRSNPSEKFQRRDKKRRRMLDSNEETRILEKVKKIRQHENENEENDVNKQGQDRISDLPDCIILHILSFLNTEHIVQTCVLSTRWKHLWKPIPTLMLHSSRFTTFKKFNLFVHNILTLRDSSTAPLHAIDLYRRGDIEPQLLKKILNYVCTHSTHLRELGISVQGDIPLIFGCVSSCQALTSLKLSVYPRGATHIKTLFPKSLNLPLLTTLDLTSFVFCAGESSCAEPFLAFTKLNSLFICSCDVKDAQILKISSETLVNLSMQNNSRNFSTIELSAPSLCTFTFTGCPIQEICRSGLSSVKQVNIHAGMYSRWDKPPMILFSWLLNLANVKSLRVSSSTLRVLSLVPDLLEVKLASLCKLKFMEIKVKPDSHQMRVHNMVIDAMLKKATAKSRKEAAKLRKAIKAGLQPPPIPDGMVEFLLQNSPSAKVDIKTINSTNRRAF